MIRRKLSLYRSKILVSLRDFGIKHTLHRMLEEVLLRKSVLYRQYTFYDKQLTDLDSPRLRNPQLKFSFVSAADKELLEQIENLSGLSQELVSELLMNGGECVVAKDNNKLACLSLISTGKVHIRYLDTYMRLSKSEAWGEQVTVAPQYRRSGVATDVQYLMFHRLAEKGYERYIGGYVPFNTRSRLWVKKFGSVKREKVTLLKIFKWKKLFAERLSPASDALPLSSRFEDRH